MATASLYLLPKPDSAILNPQKRGGTSEIEEGNGARRKVQGTRYKVKMMEAQSKISKEPTLDQDRESRRQLYGLGGVLGG